MLRWLMCIVVSLAGWAHAQTWDPPLGTRHTYKTVDGRELGLWVLEPKDVGAKDFAAVRPAVLLVHGGGWTNGAAGVHNEQAKAIAQHGAVAVLLQYRLIKEDSSDSPRVCVEDTKSAMRWLREHANELKIDANKLAAGGSSAGGYNALYAAVGPGWDDPHDNLTVSARPDALVLLNPALDNSSGSGYAHKRFGDESELRSTLRYVSRNVPPMIILSGSADPIIHAVVVEHYAAQMKAAGAHVELHLFPGQVHSFYKKEPYLSETNMLMINFLASLGFVRK